MAGFLVLGNDQYIGTYKASEEVENGAFVELDHKEKTGKLAGAGATEVYFVANEDDNAPEFGISTLDFRVKEGVFLRAHRPQIGDILATTVIEGDLVEGEGADVVAGGKVGASAGGQFVVKELTNEYGVTTARLLVVGKANAGGGDDG